ncbi:hypothetical protein CUMW_237310 [Citrus unshiu]|uniref:Methyltransferase type 11 domain-containing protein n=1 Tax=Citrus unshiu TaxID=55188 RepID=A0A2H5QKZ6_CITUN|nr:hypothetical protein CUMW_237310 [Citrus unshiu]
MARLFNKQAKLYLDARPTYPREWYSMLASLTTHHLLAWDVGTGNGQAALGFEGQPLELDMPKQVSFEGFLRMLRSFSAVNTAVKQGVDLLSEKVVKELETAWGGCELVRTIIYKTFMLAGKVKAYY